MGDKELQSFLSHIGSLDEEAMAQARAYQEQLAMPPGSMGKLQTLAVQLAGITGKVKNSIQKKRIIVLCADNGVVAEAVSSAPQSVTAAQAVNMTRGLTGMSCLARHFCCEVQVVDLGIASDYTCPAVLNRRIRRGTGNIAREAAMSREECLRAILTGIELARRAKADGVSVIGVGEMGIGNTTTSSAVLSVLAACPPEKVTGRGGGITDAMLEHKKKVIAQAIAVNHPRCDDCIEVLAKLGGLDIAAMCGVFLGAAYCRLPVVIDGYISIVAALCAFRLCPRARDFFIASHCSQEPGYLIAARELSLSPMLQLDMRLGEGSACPLAFTVLEASCTMMNDMATFEQAQIDDAYLEGIRERST